ncbi:MAG: A24 family peptidase [bacterium]|nr:A24 family peptidase [bacterium]
MNIQTILLLTVLVIAFFTDLKYKTIPNWLTLPAILAGLILGGILPDSGGLGSSFIGLLLGFVPFFIVYLAGGMGAGDVKLMGAIGAMMGYPFILGAILYTAIIGGIISVAAMIWHRTLWSSLKHIFWAGIGLLPGFEKGQIKREHNIHVPYGVAISLGTIGALLMTGNW